MIDYGVWDIEQLTIKRLSKMLRARYFPIIQIHDNKIYNASLGGPNRDMRGIIVHIGTGKTIMHDNAIHDWDGDPIHIE